MKKRLIHANIEELTKNFLSQVKQSHEDMNKVTENFQIQEKLFAEIFENIKKYKIHVQGYNKYVEFITRSVEDWIENTVLDRIPNDKNGQSLIKEYQEWVKKGLDAFVRDDKKFLDSFSIIQWGKLKKKDPELYEKLAEYSHFNEYIQDSIDEIKDFEPIIMAILSGETKTPKQDLADFKAFAKDNYEKVRDFKDNAAKELAEVFPDFKANMLYEIDFLSGRLSDIIEKCQKAGNGKTDSQDKQKIREELKALGKELLEAYTNKGGKYVRKVAELINVPGGSYQDKLNKFINR